MAEIPNGYDLFVYGWPPTKPKWFDGEPKNHSLYSAFIHMARDAGFDTNSVGFQESEYTYFGFFMMGRNWR